DTQSILEPLVKIPDWRRLDDIEESEDDERYRLNTHIFGHEPQHEPERNDFVPHHRTVIRAAQLFANLVASPAPISKRHNQCHSDAGIGQTRYDQYPKQPS